MSAYEDGLKAALAGDECWANPHCTRDSMQHDFHAWFAGWCCGKQIEVSAPTLPVPHGREADK